LPTFLDVALLISELQLLRFNTRVHLYGSPTNAQNLLLFTFCIA
jgi:hypothetical protein